MDVTIIVPTYNEAENIPVLIERIFGAVEPEGFECEVIVVDDDSPDGTTESARGLEDSYKNLTVICRKGKRGLSSAVIDGIEAAGGEIIGFMDADLSHHPESIPELVGAITFGDCDIAIGSRFTEGGDAGEMPPLRRVFSWIAAHTARGLTGVRDPMSGFFFFRKGVIDGIELSPRGFKIGLDILVKGRYRKVAEVPISFGKRGYGRSKMSADVIKEDLLNLIKLYIKGILSHVSK